MESIHVITVVVAICAVVYTVYIHVQEVSALETRLQQLETLPPPAPQKHKKTAEASHPPPIRPLPAPRRPERPVESCEKAVETDPLPEESRKRPREDSQGYDREEIRRKAIGNNGRNRQDKAAAYINANFQRSKERFLASVGDLSKKAKAESAAKYESPKAGRSDTLTYTSPSEAQNTRRAEADAPLAPQKEEQTSGLFAPAAQPSTGSLFGSTPPPTATAAGTASSSGKEQQSSSSSLFGGPMSSPSQPPASAMGTSLFASPSLPSAAPSQPAPTQPSTTAQPTPTGTFPNLSAPSAPSGPSQTPSSLLGSGLFGVTEQAAPKPPASSLFQAPPPQTTSLFGAPVTSTNKPADTQAKTLFGTTQSAEGFPAPSASSSLFGPPKQEPTLPATPQVTPADAAKSLFPTSSPTASLFTAPKGDSSFPQFGSTAQTSQTALFGGPTSLSASAGPLFGTPAASTSNLFGNASKPAEGGTTSSLFGNLPAGFSQPITATPLFGASATGPSLFPSANSKT